MYPKQFHEWLTSSPRNSSERVVEFQGQMSLKTAQHFPLSGRAESLQFIASCFRATYDHHRSMDRKARKIPVCTGLPGLGMTRLLMECTAEVLDLTKIDGKRLRAIVSFGKDGSPDGAMDAHLGIECAFAWRVIHALFRSEHKFEDWMVIESPSNQKDKTFDLVLQIVKHHWNAEPCEELLHFVGIDEYQNHKSRKFKPALGSYL